MKTKVYDSYSAFLARADKLQNGVSAAFAAEHSDFEKDNKSNESCWNCSGCSGCSGCSRCSGCSDCSDCSRCSGCSRCSRCSDCSGCSDCSDCSGLKNARPVAQEASKSWFDVPVIKGIHARVLAAAKNPDAFDMGSWHSCDTTHCRGGWVVTLAGEKGRALEAASSTLFAAMQIYHASCPDVPVSPVRFFETNEVAMADMERCAKEEAALAK